MLSGRLLVLFVVLLFKKKVGARREERVRRLARRDRRDHMTILGAEAAQHVQHLAGLAHRLADVPERISQLLEASSVLGDIHVALHQISELGLQIDYAMKLVVAELIMDGLPDAIGRGLWGAHDVAHVLGDGDVEPTDDALIDDVPLGIMALFMGGLR
jgi:hypothetical protein